MNSKQDSGSPLLRVAVIGSGPSGLYAAEALSDRCGDAVSVDVIERLPTPFGLVRYGVAPDHHKIKSMVSTFHAIFERPTVRFLGGLEFGVALDASDLRRHYHAVIYATGAQTDRDLGIPGERLRGSHSATEFVSWYNGHPLGRASFDLSQTNSVVVVGAGNVALDVVRILAKTADELRRTDVPEVVYEALRRSAVREIHLVSRRGPLEAKFSTKELRELAALDNVEVRIDPAVLPAQIDDTLPRAVKNNLQTFASWSRAAPRQAERRIELHFWRAPSQIHGSESCTAVELADTLSDAAVSDCTAAARRLDAQLVVRAIGYRSVELPGVPFDAAAGIVPNEAGRVLAEDKRGFRAGEYVTGWLKRGPTGVVGTNRADADGTVGALLADFDGVNLDEREPIERSLSARGVASTDLDGWLRIDVAERDAGRVRDAHRVKIPDLEALYLLARRPS